MPDRFPSLIIFREASIVRGLVLLYDIRERVRIGSFSRTLQVFMAITDPDLLGINDVT